MRQPKCRDAGTIGYLISLGPMAFCPQKTSATWRKRGFSKAMEAMESMGPEIFGMSPHLVTLSFFEPFENTFQEPLLWSQRSMESMV